MHALFFFHVPAVSAPFARPLNLHCVDLHCFRQLWVNYKRKSGESLSLTFLYIWLAGDVLNVLGATMDNLLLTMVRLFGKKITLATNNQAQ